MYSWAKYLSRAGFDISVLTTSKKGQVVKPFAADTSGFRVYELDYFDPITFAGLDKKDTLNKISDRTSDKNLKNWFFVKLARIYRERLNERIPGRTDLWILRAIKELKKQKQEGRTYDYIISSYGPPSAHIIGFFAKKRFYARWIADYRDLWVENHIYIGLWPFTWLEKWIERIIISHADAIISVSKYLSSVLQSKFLSIPVSVIENGFDSEDIVNSQDNYFSKEEKKFRIVYTGSIYRGKRDPWPLFKAVRELIDSGHLEPSSLEILFWGSVQGDVEKSIHKYKLYSISRYNGTVPRHEALDIQKSADALLFLEWSDSEDKDIFTAKIFEYLAINRPVIAIGISEKSNIGQLIEASGSGIACGNDVEKIKHVIMQMLNGSYTMKKNWELIDQFSRKAEVDRLIRCLEGVIIGGIEF